MEKLNTVLLKSSLIVLFLISFQTAYSQTDGEIREVKMPALEKFYGTWRYEKKDEIFEITLKKHINTRKNVSVEFVEGSHIYKKRNILVDGNNDRTLSTIFLGKTKLMPKRNENIITFRFGKDVGNPLAYGELEYVAGSTPVLIWSITPPIVPGVILEDKPVIKKEHKVPTKLTLKKVR